MEKTKPTKLAQEISEALAYVFTSPNELDSNFETANIVDGLYVLARAIHRLAAVMEEGKNAKEVSAD